MEIERKEKAFPQSSLKLNGEQTAKEIFDTYINISDAEKKAFYNNILLKARHFGEVQSEIAETCRLVAQNIFIKHIIDQMNPSEPSSQERQPNRNIR